MQVILIQRVEVQLLSIPGLTCAQRPGELRAYMPVQARVERRAVGGLVHVVVGATERLRLARHQVGRQIGGNAVSGTIFRFSPATVEEIHAGGVAESRRRTAGELQLLCQLADLLVASVGIAVQRHAEQRCRRAASTELTHEMLVIMAPRRDGAQPARATVEGRLEHGATTVLSRATANGKRLERAAIHAVERHENDNATLGQQLAQIGAGHWIRRHDGRDQMHAVVLAHPINIQLALERIAGSPQGSDAPADMLATADTLIESAIGCVDTRVVAVVGTAKCVEADRRPARGHW